MSRRGLEVWRFFGDPAPLARDNILEIILPISGQMNGGTDAYSEMWNSAVVKFCDQGSHIVNDENECNRFRVLEMEM